MATTNAFIGVHVPILWGALIAEFGTEVDYWPEGNDSNAVPVELVWMDGVAGEAVSPGRYSSVLVKHSDLPAVPQLADAISKDGAVFDIVRIDAYPYECSRLVLHLRDDA
jgi:hypothetical protein